MRVEINLGANLGESKTFSQQSNEGFMIMTKLKLKQPNPILGGRSLAINRFAPMCHQSRVGRIRTTNLDVFGASDKHYTNYTTELRQKST